MEADEARRGGMRRVRGFGELRISGLAKCWAVACVMESSLLEQRILFARAQRVEGA